MKKRLALVLLVVFIILIAISIIRINTNEVPDTSINQARKMLSKAWLSKSQNFDAANYEEAVLYYDSAMAEWNRENDKFILFRNYSRIYELAEKSLARAKKAIKTSKESISKMEDILEDRIVELGELIHNFEETFSNFPVSKDHREQIIRCKLQYEEGVLAFQSRNHAVSISKLDSAESIINSVIIPYTEVFNSYLSEYPEWKEITEKSIRASKRYRSNVIVVDKLARSLMIYRNGVLLNSFTVELGTNWIGDKQQRGDKSTPEGYYKVTEKNLMVRPATTKHYYLITPMRTIKSDLH